MHLLFRRHAIGRVRRRSDAITPGAEFEP
jgi:hypothetical protein